MKIIIYTDGGARGNPGKSALGVVICDEKSKILKEYGELLPDGTNNEAEYQAVIFALKKIKALYGKEKCKEIELDMRADSELLVKQMNGIYKIENQKIQQFFLEIWNLKTDFKGVKFSHIEREKNALADALVNRALDQVLF